MLPAASAFSGESLSSRVTQNQFNVTLARDADYFWLAEEGDLSLHCSVENRRLLEKAKGPSLVCLERTFIYLKQNLQNYCCCCWKGQSVYCVEVCWFRLRLCMSHL